MSAIFFPNLKHPIRSSVHGTTRLKHRAGFKTKRQRLDFIKAASLASFSLQDIPNISQFKEIRETMKNVIKKSLKKNPYCNIYFFKDYFLIISVSGKIITLYDVNPKLKGSYDKIAKFKKNQIS